MLPNSFIVSCNDGLRPVCYLLEVMDEEVTELFENQLKQKVEDAKAQLELQKDINCIKNGKILYLSNAIAESADVYPGDGEDCVTSECLANEE